MLRPRGRHIRWLRPRLLVFLVDESLLTKEASGESLSAFLLPLPSQRRFGCQKNEDAWNKFNNLSQKSLISEIRFICALSLSPRSLPATCFSIIKLPLVVDDSKTRPRNFSWQYSPECKYLEFNWNITLKLFSSVGRRRWQRTSAFSVVCRIKIVKRLFILYNN